MTKKKTAAEKAATTKEAKKATAPKAASTPRKEVDVSKINQQEGKKRLGSIYRLEKSVERTKSVLEAASKTRRSAKANHEKAVDVLEKEIRDQRFGPGPLFDVSGQAAAAS